ncbi:MAG: hypothetical protein ACXVEF_38280 [Polyangiales bacterium]
MTAAVPNATLGPKTFHSTPAITEEGKYASAVTKPCVPIAVARDPRGTRSAMYAVV